MRSSISRALEPLGHSAIELADPADDLRGREVRDNAGEHVGHVEDILIDPDEARGRLVLASTDGMLGIGKHRYLVPIEVVRAEDDTVTVDRPRAEIEKGPGYQPDALDDEDEAESAFAEVYAWYGLDPYWVQNASR